jgi:membrane associated rhomboid family serine protease
MALNKQTKQSLILATNFIGVLAVIEIVTWFVKFPIKGFGIRPRNPEGAIGILFAPLLHGNVQHLAANSLPLWILIVLLFADRKYKPWNTFWLVWIVSGLGTWLIGRNENNAVHIGASSLIFGFAAYLMLSGILMRSWRSFFVALVVFVFFGGIFYGALPQNGPISWEGHLCGAIAGLWAAWRTH